MIGSQMAQQAISMVPRREVARHGGSPASRVAKLPAEVLR